MTLNPRPAPSAGPRRRPSSRALAGLFLLGYGALVLLRVLPHDDPVAGTASLLLGAVLLAWGLPTLRPARPRFVALLGAVCVAGLLAYNGARGSALSPPEMGILAYGTALLATAPFLGRTIGRIPVSSVVGWSFPILLAPLALFALNGSLSTGQGAAAAPVVRSLVVLPTAAALRLLGTPVDVSGTSLQLDGANGSMTLGVGLVCAGLYPLVLFGGLVGLYAWQNRAPPNRLALALGVGVLGLWIFNVLRLVALTKIGQAWGSQALQDAHANLGWILFAAYMAAFWPLLFRFVHGPRGRTGKPPGGLTASAPH